MRTQAHAAVSFAAFASVLLCCRIAFGCVNDADCDNGDICSVPDACIGGSCALGGGGDTNADLICDDEFDGALGLNATRLVIRRRNSLRDDNSAVGGGGDLLVSGAPDGAFTAVDGIAIRVVDALAGITPPADDGVADEIAWTPGECITKSTGTIACRKPDGKNYVKFKPNPVAATQYKFSFKMKGIGNLAGPFFGPVRIVLSNGSRRTVDTIFDCQLKLSGLRCREF